MFNALFDPRGEQNNTVDEYSVYDFSHIIKIASVSICLHD
ncbi:hypothetical protein PULV_a1365 [Pseudoalteromonas ulvae UL12]|nr:hypothetical protein [Pseudoalteromonas ulvae UL12]